MPHHVVDTYLAIHDNLLYVLQRHVQAFAYRSESSLWKVLKQVGCPTVALFQKMDFEFPEENPIITTTTLSNSSTTTLRAQLHFGREFYEFFFANAVLATQRQRDANAPMPVS